MTDELSSDNLHHLKEMEKRFSKQKEKQSIKTLSDFDNENISLEEKITKLANQHSYTEILTIAKQNNILAAGPKMKMLRMLLEKELFI